MSDFKKRLASLDKKISKIETARTELSRERYRLTQDNFAEIYVGKFWKYDDGSMVTFSYCHSVNHSDFANWGVMDCFTIVNNTLVTFDKNFEQHSMNIYCKEEISREEYDEALERFKNLFFAFIRIERKVLIEKHKHSHALFV